MIKYSILIISLALSAFKECGQNTHGFDTAKVSKDTELNFYQTDKRGIESNTGDIYYVGENKKMLIAFHAGRIKWKADIIKACGIPDVGEPAIRYIRLDTGKIFVVFAKHDFADVDMVTGKITCLGAK